jgi:hypothetical protein
MKEETLDSIKHEFADIYAAIRDLSDEEILNGPDDVFRPHFQRLQRLAATDVDDHAAERILSDREFQSAARQICHLKAVNGLRMEIESARSIIGGPDPWALVKRFVFYPNYVELARMEFEGGDLKEGARVVFLGSGPLPLSLICLCKQYGVKGIGIEQAPEYGELSREVIQSLELSRHIAIVQGNHFSLPLQEECRLIMVGADALPKDEIFAHLAKALPNGAMLSYRIYEKGLRRLLDDQSVFDLPPEFREYARIRPEPPVNNTSVFIIKNTSHYENRTI